MLDFIHQPLHSGSPACSTLHGLLRLNCIEVALTAFLAVVTYRRFRLDHDPLPFFKPFLFIEKTKRGRGKSCASPLSPLFLRRRGALCSPYSVFGSGQALTRMRGFSRGMARAPYKNLTSKALHFQRFLARNMRNASAIFRTVIHISTP